MRGAEVKPLPEAVRRVLQVLQARGHPHAQPSVTLIDSELFRFDEIWAAAGHPHGVFRLRPHDLQHLTGAPVADVVVAPAAGEGP